MVRFTLFGVPVVIQPWFWLTSAMLGGLFEATNMEDFVSMLIFTLAGTVSILVHGFGHALTGRRLAGGNPRIELTAFAGYAYNENARFTKWQDFWMTAARPLAGLSLFSVVILILCAVFGLSDGYVILLDGLYLPAPGLSESSYEFLSTHLRLHDLVTSLIWINFWWSLINLLPVLPLDGGQIAALFVKPRRRILKLAFITAVGMALTGAVFMGSWYVAILFGFLAWRNYQEMSESKV